MIKRMIAAAFAVLCMATSSASALTWTLHDIVLDDGGDLAGSFDWDGTNYTNVSISYSNGSAFPDSTFLVLNPLSSPELFVGEVVGAGVGTPYVGLSFTSPLPATGGIFYFSISNPIVSAIVTCTVYPVDHCTAGNLPVALLTSGYISSAGPPPTVPLPAGLPLLIGAFGMLGVAVRKNS